MSVGIIVYSHTGHTLSVARKLKERLSVEGRPVRLEALETVGPANPSATTAVLKNTPAIDAYDTLVFCSPVNGGRMSAPMASFLEEIPSLEGKKAACLVTHFLFQSWGTNQTLEQMTEVCKSKGATVCGAGAVRWSSLRRRRKIANVVNSLAECF